MKKLYDMSDNDLNSYLGITSKKPEKKSDKQPEKKPDKQPEKQPEKKPEKKPEILLIIWNLALNYQLSKQKVLIHLNMR